MENILNQHYQCKYINQYVIYSVLKVQKKQKYDRKYFRKYKNDENKQITQIFSKGNSFYRFKITFKQADQFFNWNLQLSSSMKKNKKGNTSKGKHKISNVQTTSNHKNKKNSEVFKNCCSTRHQTEINTHEDGNKYKKAIIKKKFKEKIKIMEEKYKIIQFKFEMSTEFLKNEINEIQTINKILCIQIQASKKACQNIGLVKNSIIEQKNRKKVFDQNILQRQIAVSSSHRKSFINKQTKQVNLVRSYEHLNQLEQEQFLAYSAYYAQG